MERNRRYRVFVALLGLLVLSAVPALADGPTLPDWAGAATNVYNGVVPVVHDALPICATLMALILGVRLARKLVSTFAK